MTGHTHKLEHEFGIDFYVRTVLFSVNNDDGDDEWTSLQWC